MLKQPLFWEMSVLILIVGFLDFIANVNHLYWAASEFDSVVHFSAGAAVAALFLWLYFFSRIFNPSRRGLAAFLAVAVLGTVLISTLWEIYEIFIDEIKFNPRYSFDTTLDFTMAILGAVGVSFYGYLKELKRKKA